MKAGQLFDCPHCNQNTFLMKEAVMDGWTKKCDVLKCASCGAVIEEIKENDSFIATQEQQNKKRNALAALFGEEPAEDLKTANADFFNTEKHFCRDCQFRVMNAFRIRCSKHEKDVNPMDDCPDFKARVEEK